MADIRSLFVTRLYRARLAEHGPTVNPDELAASCLSIAEDDEAGQRWSEENDYPGYTSYASLADLPWRFPVFTDLKDVLDKHVAAFLEDLEYDLGDQQVVLEDPRSARMMAAPPRRKDAREELRTFVYVRPQVGDVLLWESWLRHEVPLNMADDDERISVSFNYRWG